MSMGDVLRRDSCGDMHRVSGWDIWYPIIRVEFVRMHSLCGRDVVSKWLNLTVVVHAVSCRHVL
jgi:hypothetical protein